MEIVVIDDSYIEYLKIFSINVKDNKKSKRPYVGIVLNINNYNYFAPLSSPKLKHLKMKENIDFLKIDHGKLGVINLNNMIPVPMKNIKPINFKNYDDKYQELLKSQSIWLNKNEVKIKKAAKKIYKFIKERENTQFHKRCNNFKLLEEKCDIFKNIK